MKIEKNRLLIVMIILIVVIILEFVAIILLVNKDNSTTNGNTNNNDLNIENNPSKSQITCSVKAEETDSYTSSQKYIINYDNTGEITNYTNQYLYNYKDKEVYNGLKNSMSDDDTVKFVDSQLQLIRSYSSDGFKNENNEVIHVWFKEFIDSLKNQGYVCE